MDNLLDVVTKMEKIISQADLDVDTKVIDIQKLSALYAEIYTDMVGQDVDAQQADMLNLIQDKLVKIKDWLIIQKTKTHEDSQLLKAGRALNKYYEVR